MILQTLRSYRQIKILEYDITRHNESVQKIYRAYQVYHEFRYESFEKMQGLFDKERDFMINSLIQSKKK